MELVLLLGVIYLSNLQRLALRSVPSIDNRYMRRHLVVATGQPLSLRGEPSRPACFILGDVPGAHDWFEGCQFALAF